MPILASRRQCVRVLLPNSFGNQDGEHPPGHKTLRPGEHSKFPNDDPTLARQITRSKPSGTTNSNENGSPNMRNEKGAAKATPIPCKV
jgi:hypothetical protein